MDAINRVPTHHFSRRHIFDRREPDTPGGHPIRINLRKSPSFVRRGERGRVGLGGPLWPPASLSPPWSVLYYKNQSLFSIAAIDEGAISMPGDPIFHPTPYPEVNAVLDLLLSEVQAL